MAHLDSFRTARWVRTLNLVLQAVLFFTFFAGLNYLARNHPSRFDLTAHRRYTLSPETLSWVQHLPSPVHIIATLPEDGDNPAVRGLLGEYQHAAEANPTGRITVEYLDVDLNRGRAEKLGVDQPNVIVLRSGDRQHVKLLDELYRIKDKERVAFQGEQVLTSALLDVTDPQRKRIYFLTGHGELVPEETDARRGLSALRDQLKVRNFEVVTISLTVERKIPDDAALIVVVAPHKPFTRAEQELLRQYLGAGAGRLLLMLEPGERVSELGLLDLLDDWSVLVDDDRIFDTGKENVAEDGDLLIHAYQAHPIMDSLKEGKLWLQFGATRSLRPLPFQTGNAGLTVSTLAATSPNAWGEMKYRDPSVFQQYDPGVDIRPRAGLDVDGRLGVIVAAERAGPRGNLPISVPGGRLVVFGTGDLVANSRLAIAGNLNVFLNAVNWATDRENQLKIPARPIERYQLSLSAGELLNLRSTLLFVVPGIAALLGGLVYWTRRK